MDNLPFNLTIIIFGNEFNKSVDKPPLNLASIIGEAFNKKVNNLPSKLTNLVFGTNKTYHFVSKCMILLVTFYIKIFNKKYFLLKTIYSQCLILIILSIR